MTTARTQADQKVAVGNGVRRQPIRDEIWRRMSKASFAVLSDVTPNGEPRSSGVVTTPGEVGCTSRSRRTAGRCYIPATGQVAVTVPVRHGGLLSSVRRC